MEKADLFYYEKNDTSGLRRNAICIVGSRIQVLEGLMHRMDEYLIRDLDADIYILGLSSNLQSTRNIFSYFGPQRIVKMMVFHDENRYNQYFYEMIADRNYIHLKINTMFMFYNIQQCMNWVQSMQLMHRHNYNIVGRLRPDIALDGQYNTLETDIADRQSIYIPYPYRDPNNDVRDREDGSCLWWGHTEGVNDQVAFGSPSVMNLYAIAFEEFRASNPNSFYDTFPESFLYNYLKVKNITLKPLPRFKYNLKRV